MTTEATHKTLLVAEVFGPTLQGEGPSCGQQALFLRLSRCNLSCPRCDTPFTWDTTRFDLREHTELRTAGSIIAWVLDQPTQLLVITGGEPLLQQGSLLPIVTALADSGRRVEIETNGTVIPTAQLIEHVAAFNVSPKLKSFAAQRDIARRINASAMQVLAASGKAVFKFVVAHPAELDEVGDVVNQFNLNRVWVMPEGTSSSIIVTRMQQLADAVLKRGWNLTTRLQVLLWEDTRGR